MSGGGGRAHAVGEWLVEATNIWVVDCPHT
jgi:hypothetical protein